MTIPRHCVDPAKAIAEAVDASEGDLNISDALEEISVGSKLRTILVIDDDEAVRDLLKRFLTRNGFHVLLACDGQEGLKLAREAKPDAITLDVLMPKIDGWAVLRALKEEPKTADIPVIVISIVDDRNMGFALGAAEYLTKPIDNDRLFDVLEKLCPGDREHHVLIIEDDTATREMMRRVVDRAHWKTREATNGVEGLERLKEGIPDVIVLDLMMPRMDGFQFLVRLREEPKWASIPVVVVTAKSLSATDREFFDGRVKRLVQKGEEDLSNLLSVLNGALPTGHD